MHNTFHLFICSVAQAYINQKKLDTETKILQANASQFSKQTLQWLKLVEDFNTALKVCIVSIVHTLNCMCVCVCFPHFLLSLPAVMDMADVLNPLSSNISVISCW